MRPILLIFFGLTLLSSCNHYESSVPLSTPENSNINPALLGEWILTEEKKEKDTSGFIEVIAFNKNEYLVQLKEYVDSSKHIASVVCMRMFDTKIDKNTYLNLQFIGDNNEKSFMIYKFKPISGNRYKIFYLSKEHFIKEFDQTNKFQAYVRSHIKEFEKSFVQEGILSRKTGN
jgi:hypothetical protein